VAPGSSSVTNPALNPYPGTFLHGLDLDDWYPCWNISLSGQIMSPDFLALVDEGLRQAHTSVREVPLEALVDPSRLPGGVPTPRAINAIFAASGLRTRLGDALDAPDAVRRIIRMGDLEVEVESARRAVRPDAPSRLSSIYLADNTSHGRAHIMDMLGYRRLYIVNVSVPGALRAARFDTAWFDAYARDPKDEYLEHYWNGEQYGGQYPTWEHLVEGVVRLDDAAQLAHIRAEGVGPPGWPDGESLPSSPP
jgi:hypothetical protein